MHDIFCSAPGNLSQELDSFHAVAGEVNETVGMSCKTLLACLCLKSDNLIFLAGDAAVENIRGCSFFVQVLQDSWGPAGLFRGLYDAAAKCLKDEQAPMREIAIFVRSPSSMELPPGAPVYRYETIEGFERQLRTVLTEWLNAVLSQAREVSA